jgi:arginine utilization protein RocB
MKAFVASLPADTDAREISVATAEWLVAQAGILGPAIIVGFVPPYYPQRLNHRKNESERHLRRVIEDMCQEAGVLAGDGATYMTEVFGGITDLSFLGFEGEREDLEALADNTPAWGDAYWLPMEELLALDIPIANMGPAGRDAHKWTERLELKYSFEIIPNLLLKTINRLANND